MTKRITALILSIICCLGLLTACYDKQIDGEIIKGAEITLYLGEQVLDLDPALCYNNDSALQICGLIYNVKTKLRKRRFVTKEESFVEYPRPRARKELKKETANVGEEVA